MKEYEIVKQESGKYIIIYYIDGQEETREHYAYADGVPVRQIMQGYTEKTK